MTYNSNSENLWQRAVELQSRGIEFHHIEADLKEKGATVEEVERIVKDVKALYYVRRKKRGFKLVLIGSILLVFGFLITLFLFHSGNSITTAMYGITIIGIVILLWGMVDIMGW